MSQVFKGHRSYGDPILRGDISDVYVGKYCSIAQNVICDCGWHHRSDFVTTYPLNVFFEPLKHLTGHPKSNGDILIENDVWIGEGVVIMSGVTICDGSVVGAGAIVTKDVEPYSIVAGVPARLVRKRFTEWQIDALLKIKWWDWTEERIIESGALMMQNDIDKFIEFYR